MKSFADCYDDQTKKVGMSETCSTYATDITNTCKIYVGISEGKRLLGRLRSKR
jgi:hypothetical protein